MGCYVVAAMLEEPPSVAYRQPRRELGPSPLCCCYTPLGEGRGDPSRFRLAPRRVSLLVASRAVRNPLPPSCVLEGTHVILTRSNPDQISFMRRFGTSDE